MNARSKSAGWSKWSLTVSLAALISSVVCLSVCHAENSEVLPKGIWTASVNNYFYLPIYDKFNDKGDVVPIAEDYNAVLDSTVFTGLKDLEKIFGMPSGSAMVGRSDVTFHYQIYAFDFLFAYGITDRLSFGVKIPYWYQKNIVDASLDTRFATVGKNAALGILAPLNVPGTVPLTTQDVINLLGKGLDINGDGKIDVRGYGYRRFGTWSDSGLSDMDAGFKFQYLTTKDWRLAAQGGVRFPTGQIDETDDLVDRGFGAGVWGSFFALNNDYVGIKDLTLDFTFRYYFLAPGEFTMRIPRTVHEPITANKATVELDYGDVFEFEVSAAYNLSEAWSLSAIYRYGFALQDQVSGPPKFSYRSLEDETDFEEHIGIVGLSYSTLPLYKAKKFPFPLSLSLSYRNRFAGRDVLKSQYIGFGLSAYF